MQETTYTTDQTEAISAGEQRIAKARSAHDSAVTELIAALESQVVRKTLALYPTAVTLVTNTSLGEDIALDCGWHMHPERVLDSDRNVIAGYEQTNIDNGWDAYCDSVTDYLDQMIELDDSYAQDGSEYELDLISKHSGAELDSTGMEIEWR